MLPPDKIRDTLFWLDDYHAYRFPNGTKNPSFNNFGRLILDLKESDCPKHTRAVNVLTRQLNNSLTDFFTLSEPFFVAIIPSHQKNTVSQGLRSIVKTLKNSYNIQNSNNLLIRHTSIVKLARGGNRSVEVHLNSIRIRPNILTKRSKVLLLDDITTTGNSFEACKSILQNAGAGLIIQHALGHSV